MLKKLKWLKRKKRYVMIKSNTWKIMYEDTNERGIF